LTGEGASEESVLALREEVLQRVESVGNKIRRLSLITIFVAAALVLGFASQIALPYASGSPTRTVNLADPVLVGVEVLLTALALVWLYVGVSDYRFVSGLTKSIKEARARETDLEKSLSN
jgi:protein-S-isoprenylcysteine O-methyltransferase Ste14